MADSDSSVDSDFESAIKEINARQKRIASKQSKKKVYLKDSDSDVGTSVSQTPVNPLDVLTSVLSPEHKKIIDDLCKESEGLKTANEKLKRISRFDIRNPVDCFCPPCLP